MLSGQYRAPVAWKLEQLSIDDAIERALVLIPPEDDKTI